ncbi:hypothetical protein VTN00DRAFT_9881 [Thermoascus crustaceus]|uniref:uncharacterized protein n=1 Tax=Thermoascus crustaceus TaxID=5088 RepID=UPI003743D2E1
MVINREHWEEVSVPTVVAKLHTPTTSPTSTELFTAAIKDISESLQVHGLNFKISDTTRIWSLFGASTAAGAPSKPPSTRWPFTRGYNTIGMSAGRTNNTKSVGTIGGYFKFRDPDSNERVIGITCYHVVREGPQGEVDDREYNPPIPPCPCPRTPEIEPTGATNVNHPCLYPALPDMEAAKAIYSTQASLPIPPGLHPAIAAEENAKRQEARRKLHEINSYNPNIGNVLAVSGWRNVALHASSSSSSATAASNAILIDWACIEIRSNTQSTYSANYIGDIARDLQYAQSPAAPYRTSNDHHQLISKTIHLPSQNTILFKKGRTTGITAGTLAPSAPALIRIKKGLLPAARAFVITRDVLSGQHFAGNGDAGAWCLTGGGELVGLFVAGDERDGSGLMIPIEVVMEDIERTLGLSPGS